jgi:hypothetical protein
LHRNGLARVDFDFFQDACCRRRNFRIDFVGRNLKKRFVALDLLARLLQPLRDCAFVNAFAHLGHDDVDSHGLSPSGENSGGAEALFVPDTGDAFELVNFVPAVEKTHRLHGRNAVSKLQLFRLELVVVLPGF